MRLNLNINNSFSILCLGVKFYGVIGRIFAIILLQFTSNQLQLSVAFFGHDSDILCLWVCNVCRSSFVKDVYRSCHQKAINNECSSWYV